MLAYRPIQGLKGAYRRNNSETIYYQKAIPARVRGIIGKSNWRVCLGTSDETFARAKIAEVDRTFARQVRAADDHISQQEKHRNRLSNAEAKLASAGSETKKLVSDAGGIEGFHAQARRVSKARTYLEVGLAMEQDNFDYEERTADDIEEFEERIAAETGTLGLYEERERKYAASLRALELDTDAETQSIVAKAQPGLRTTLERWKRFHKPSTERARHVEREVEAFIDIMGDIALTDLRSDDARRYIEILEALPSLSSQNKQAVTTREKLAYAEQNPDVPRLKAQTVINRFGHIKMLVAKAYEYEMIDRDTFDPVKLKTRAVSHTQLSQDRRTAFNRSELIEFREAVIAYRDSKKHRLADRAKAIEAYWASMIAIYVGVRLEEVCQMQVTDVDREQLTMWVNDSEPFQNVKNENAVRLVPIHPELIRLGFLEYLKRRGNYKLLFGDDERIQWKQEKSDRTLGSNISKRISRVLQKTGIMKRAAAEKRKLAPFHSLRHSWEDLACEADLSRSVRRQIAGRQKDDDRTQAGYGAGVSMETKHTAIAKIDPFGEGPFSPVSICSDDGRGSDSAI